MDHESRDAKSARIADAVRRRGWGPPQLFTEDKQLVIGHRDIRERSGVWLLEMAAGQRSGDLDEKAANGAARSRAPARASLLRHRRHGGYRSS